MPAAASSDLLKADEVAAELRVSRDSVYRLIHSGRLEAFRIGASGPLRVRRAAVDEILKPARARRWPRDREMKENA